MPKKLRSSLEAINEVSRQLLSQLDSKVMHDDTMNEKKSAIKSLSSDSDENVLNNKGLLNLVNERQHLITHLFNNYTQNQLGSELDLINEMVSLDKQLTSTSQKNKDVLSQQVIKLKKSNKVKNLYQKY